LNYIKNNNLRICFVALNSYNVIANSADIKHVGGSETQQLIIAHWLLQQGIQVSFITLDHGQPDGIEHNNIRIHKAYATSTGLPGLRFIYPRIFGLWSAMKRADADVYFQRSAGLETGLVALWCRNHKRPMIFSSASNSDCDLKLPFLPKLRERILYKWGLRNATTIIVQTKNQQQLLNSSFGLKSTVIRNCFPKPSGIKRKQNALYSDTITRVLWVGRLTWVKRFEWLLDVASLCPDINFDVVGISKQIDAQHKKLVTRAYEMDNVQMHGYVPYTQMANLYQLATIVCSTSTFEGFPNIFLEAWSYGIPVLSTFDPDGIIQKHSIGWIASSVKSLAIILKEVTTSQEELKRAGKAARDYCLTNHTPDSCLQPLYQLIYDITTSKLKM
jgi:glycosyltransferase involved in cell wall biosynthesis